MKRKRLFQISWRGWHLSPLFIIGRYTLHFTNGIVLGYDNAVWLVVYLGWLIISVDNCYNRGDAIDETDICNYTHIWVIKYAK
ncbi:hypothetical protein LCGC14_0422660 [marine sediment metagenome]|uniref:Uncharacterized protein n=1 Tax=marine sediment metagenome TaxID=412755 RepID=A0A0F9VZI5_9ZZZZ